MYTCLPESQFSGAASRQTFDSGAGADSAKSVRQIVQFADSALPNGAAFEAILNICPDAVLLVGCDGSVLEANGHGIRLLEFETIQELRGMDFATFVGSTYSAGFKELIELLRRGESGSFEFDCKGRSGTVRKVRMRATPLRDSTGESVSFLGFLRDQSDLLELQRRLMQSQKLEILGQVIGGVAHDFNNLIGVVMGFSEMLLARLQRDSDSWRDAEVIRQTSERAAALTRQILDFSRKKPPVAAILDLSELVTRMDSMLRRLIGETVRLVTLPEPDLDDVEADPGQIEQVLMNLAVNARDAMNGGGTITVETRNITVAESDSGASAEAGILPGRYVVLSVSDTGTGIPDEVKARIFEPFFTTKPVGQGTGLGLATCISIVKQWKGYLTVDSKLGSGSTFSMYLPRAAKRPKKQAAPEDTVGPAPRGVETILLVEDEPGLLALTTSLLQKQGYTVLSASNGKEALRVAYDRGVDSIDLVFTDMVMPEMSGRMMADWLRAANPGIRVLFTSGYSEQGRGGGIESDMHFIPKPYTALSLLHKVREVIELPGPAGVRS